MAVRQYIGARYVPKFSDVNEGVWDNSYTYEPLTIVKHGNDYYTSKKEVPTGIAITNTEYWVLTGNYNGAISRLDEEISSLEDSISDMSSSIEDSLSEMSDSITEVRNEVENQNQILAQANLKIKKAIIIGDSYLTQHSGRIATEMMAHLNVSSDDYRIHAEGSTGFYTANNEGHRFITLLNDSEVDFTANDVTHVIVLGGANDAGVSAANLTSYITAFYNRMIELYPNAILYVGFIGATLLYSNIRNYGDACMAWKNAIDNLPKAKYLQNVEYIGHNRTMIQSDNVHPTSTAASIFAKQCAIALDRGACHVMYEINLDEGVTGFRNTYEMVDNNLSVVWVNNYKTLNMEATSWAESGLIELGDLSTGLITGSYYCDCGQVACSHVTHSGGTTLIPMTIVVQDGKLYARLMQAAGLTGVTSIIIPEFKIVMPTLYC